MQKKKKPWSNNQKGPPDVKQAPLSLSVIKNTGSSDQFIKIILLY